VKKTTLALVASNEALVTAIGYTMPSFINNDGEEPEITNCTPFASLRPLK
jgi:hypothetical protein